MVADHPEPPCDTLRGLLQALVTVTLEAAHPDHRRLALSREVHGELALADLPLVVKECPPDDRRHDGLVQPHTSRQRRTVDARGVDEGAGLCLIGQRRVAGEPRRSETKRPEIDRVVPGLLRQSDRLGERVVRRREG